MLSQFKANLDDYAKTRNFSWYWYMPSWIFGLYLFIRLLDFELGATAPSFFIAIAHGFNFILHEMAHLLTGFLPPVMTAAAGSFSELLLGASLVVTALLVRSYFASLFCFLWFMLSCLSVSSYMADARRQALDLVSFGGGDPIHDWNFIFTRLGMLEQDTMIAGLTRAVGISAGVIGLIFSAWLLISIFRSGRQARHKARMDAIMNKAARQQPTDRGSKPFIGGDLYPSAQTGRLADPDTHGSKNPPKPSV